VRGRLLVRDALVRTRTRYISVIRACSPARLPRALRQRGAFHSACSGPVPAGPFALGRRAAPRRHATPQPPAHVLRRADRAPRRPGSPRATPALRPLRGPRHRRCLPRRHLLCNQAVVGGTWWTVASMPESRKARALLRHAPLVLGAGEPRRDAFGDVLDVRAHRWIDARQGSTLRTSTTPPGSRNLPRARSRRPA
jgi:hypothetical protein